MTSQFVVNLPLDDPRRLKFAYRVAFSDFGFGSATNAAGDPKFQLTAITVTFEPCSTIIYSTMDMFAAVKLHLIMEISVSAGRAPSAGASTQAHVSSMCS